MMDEAKFAGYKDTLVHAAKQMAEEYSDAMNYASMSMEYKNVCPYASSEWYKLSGEEMEPMQTAALHRKSLPALIVRILRLA
mgnify:CR=1 FL=1